LIQTGGRGGEGGREANLQDSPKFPMKIFKVASQKPSIECLSDSQFAENRGGIYKISSVPGVRQP
jgi:hypothetical protein